MTASEPMLRHKQCRTMKPSDQNNIVWTISELINWSSGYFETRDIDSPRMTAEYLLAHTLNISRMDLYLQYDKPLSRGELNNYKALIKRRVNREPLAYITEQKGFWTLNLAVSKHVLVPRPDTECIVEETLKHIPEKNKDSIPLKIIDLGTGSGAIILSIASDRPENIYYAVDLSQEALKTAKINAKTNCPDTDITFINNNWLDSFQKEEQFDIIVSNPPYIPSGDIPDLQPEITEHEPILALDGDKDGLKCIRHIINNAHHYMKPGGWLLIETGYDQKEPVEKIATDTGLYNCIEYIRDFGGNNRVVKMRKQIKS